MLLAGRIGINDRSENEIEMAEGIYSVRLKGWQMSFGTLSKTYICGTALPIIGSFFWTSKDPFTDLESFFWTSTRAHSKKRVRKHSQAFT